jgi:ABC-type multidrug transport system, ATPase component
MSALELDGLGKRYGSKWALRDCTLEIPAGAVTALVGPNGAGKTTLLQMAVGLRRPSAGRVRVLGHDPQHDARELLPRVGFVAQDHPLHRGFTVAETLRLAASSTRPGTTSWRGRASRRSTCRSASASASCPAASSPRSR